GRAIGWSDPGVVAVTRAANLLVNATPLGRREETPLRPAALPKEGAGIELVCGKGGTPLVRKARSFGLRVAAARAILVGPGGAALELWTEKSAPLQAMRQTLSP